jgi:hypothetical protein
MSEQQQRHHPPNLADLVQDLDPHTPLHELVGDPAILEQPLEIDPKELERLDALTSEYLHELAEAGLLPEDPPLDMDSEILELLDTNRKLSDILKERDRDSDFGR